MVSSPTCGVSVLAESYVADFDGRSSLLYRFNQKSMSTLKDVISLRFKSHQAEGVLLHGEGQRGDYITLELHRGRLDLYLNLGAFPLDERSFLRGVIVGFVASVHPVAKQFAQKLPKLAARDYFCNGPSIKLFYFLL